MNPIMLKAILNFCATKQLFKNKLILFVISRRSYEALASTTEISPSKINIAIRRGLGTVRYGMTFRTPYFQKNIVP